MQDLIHLWAGFSAVAGLPDWKTVTAFWPIFVGAFILAYLTGAVPFGLILVRLSGGGDIRTIGSGNIGATNVLRTGAKSLAAATLCLDVGKGAAAVLVGARLGGPDIAFVCALGVVLGHLYPVWLRFRGGKGVATGLGVLLAASWPVGCTALGVWLAATALFRISSLSALIAVAVTPFVAWYLADPRIASIAGFLAVLVWWKHRSNIGRLFRGGEPRIKLK